MCRCLITIEQVGFDLQLVDGFAEGHQGGKAGGGFESGTAVSVIQLLLPHRHKKGFTLLSEMNALLANPVTKVGRVRQIKPL